MKKVLLVLVSLFVFAAGIVAAPRPAAPRPAPRPTAPRPAAPRPSTSVKTKNSSASDTCADIIVDLLVEVSLWNNINASFDNYPYATRPNYITINENNDGQFYRFTLDTNLFYTPAYALYGNDSRIEGFIWKFFGPVFENRIVTTKDYSSYYGKMDLGMQFSIFQLSMCTLIFDIKWEHLYGSFYENGVNIGFGIRSYPVKPLVLEYRSEWGIFANTGKKSDTATGIRKDATYKSHLEAGVMLGSPTEVYAFWDFMTDGFLMLREHSMGLGLKVHL